jgi:hypothetical protein
MSIGGGINITLQSYVDRIFFGLMTTPEHGPEFETLLDYMREELAALVAAAESVEPTALLSEPKTGAFKAGAPEAAAPKAPRKTANHRPRKVEA